MIDTTSVLGALDLEIHYTPNAEQAGQLHDPPTARRQVLDVMTYTVALHPEGRDAFHGIWVRADEGDASVFSLELPMEQIAALPLPENTSSSVAK